jgi:hypothetical protein
VGNNLRAVSGMIETRDPIAVSGTIDVDAPRDRATISGPRYPRAHLQPIAVAKR